MKDNIAIKVENLSKKYQIGKQEQYLTLRDQLVKIPNKIFSKNNDDEFWALKDASFEVEKGEVLGVIGPNGAGKSTLLKILSRITEPTGGRAVMRGKVSSILEVGTGFHQELTGRENTYLNGAILGMNKKEIDHKFDKIVEFSGLEKFIDTPVKKYSSGMRVRLAFSVAAHLDPDILLVDEVLAVGDAEFQKKSLGKMDEVSRDLDRTVVFVSHNMQSIRQLCNKAIYLKDGRTTSCLDVEEAIEMYLDTFKLKNLKKQYNRKERRKNTEIRQVSVIGNHEGNEAIISGESFQVFFLIQSLEPIDGVNIGFSIHKSTGEDIGIFYSGPDFKFNLDKGNNIIQASIDNLPVNPGTYFLRARLEKRAQTIDWPKGNLLEFEIKDGKNKLGVRRETLKSGNLCLDFNWNKKRKLC